MNADERRFDLLTERVLGAVFEVSDTLGSGVTLCLPVNVLAS
jgi:hypothetical protein